MHLSPKTNYSAQRTTFTHPTSQRRRYNNDLIYTLFGVLAEKRLLVEGGCPRWDVGYVNVVRWAEELVLGDECILSHHQDKSKVDIMVPAAGNLD